MLGDNKQTSVFRRSFGVKENVFTSQTDTGSRRTLLLPYQL